MSGRSCARCDTQQIFTVLVLAEGRRQAFELVAVYESLVEGYFLDTGDLQPLAVLDGLHELGGVDQAVVSAGVEPGIAPAEPFYRQLAVLEIALVDVADLELAAPL